MLETVKRFFRVRAAQQTFMQPTSGMAFEIARQSSPPRRGSAELAKAYRTSPWLHAVADRVATLVASNTWHVVRTENASAAKMLQGMMPSHRIRAATSMARAGTAEVVRDHPLLTLLSHGNRYLSGNECLHVTALCLDIQGESFWVNEFGDDGKPTEIWPMQPTWVSDVPGRGMPFYILQIPGAARKGVLAEDMLWIRNPDPHNPYGRGAGVGEAMADEIDTDEYAAKHIKNYFLNAGVPDAIVSLEGAGEKQVEAAEAKWQSKYVGAWNAHRVSFTNHKLNVQTFADSFKDMQIVELRKSLRDTVIQIFGVPPEILGIVENSNRSTIDAADLLCAKNVQVPRLERIRCGVQKSLMNHYSDSDVLMWDSPIPEDRDFQLRAMSAQPSAATRAEWRDRMGLEAHDGNADDVYVVSFGQIEVPADGGEPRMLGDPMSGPAGEQGGGDASGGSSDGGASGGSKAAAPRPGNRIVRAKPPLTFEQIEELVKSLQPETLTYELEPKMKELVDKWGSAYLAKLVKSDQAFNMLNPLVRKHIEQFGAVRIKNINKTTQDAIRQALSGGIAAGESMDELAGRVETVFDGCEQTRSIRIARTETINSSNFAQMSAMDQSGVIHRRAWVATLDDRVRDEHRDLNGVVVGMEEPFIIVGDDGGVDRGMFPCDFKLARNSVNCRCTTVHVLDDETDEEIANLLGNAEKHAELWKAFDAKAVPYERAFLSAARKGFATQRKDFFATWKTIA